MLIGAVLVIAVALVVFFFARTALGGPQVQGTDSMPPNVRKAFMGANSGHPTPPKP